MKTKKASIHADVAEKTAPKVHCFCTIFAPFLNQEYTCFPPKAQLSEYSPPIHLTTDY